MSIFTLNKRFGATTAGTVIFATFVIIIHRTKNIGVFIRITSYNVCYTKLLRMGNSEGGFKEYWELIRKYPKYQGGFIWDFVDQSFHKTGKNGAIIYAYGGDYNKYDASDNNFLDNGLINPDRGLNPHAHEVKYYYQSSYNFV